MDLKLRGKKALITGSSRGIGFSIAHRLAQEGCHLVIVGREMSTLEGAKSSLLAAGAPSVSTHVANFAHVEELDAILALTSDIDFLVNSAGEVPRGTINDVSSERFRQAFDVKVMGTIDLCRKALDHMYVKKEGVIVNIIGISGERYNPKSVATSCTNAALIAFTQAVGSISVDHNVRVLGINPGLIETERTKGIFDLDNNIDNSAYKHLISTLPLGRMGYPEEIANVVAFALSEQASYMSGTVLNVDGGARYRV